MNIKIEEKDDKVFMFTPYHPDIPREAKKLGGKWNSSTKSWVFDVRDKERVKKLCRSIYGTDGETSEVVTVRVTAKKQWEEYCQGLFLYGRSIARAFNRDSGAKIGDGVILLSGGFISGGSWKNWKTICKEGTIFELRDIPRKAFEENSIDSELSAEVIDQEIDKEALKEEKKRLLARIDEIDKLLK
jgi:hypothetical protein